MPLITMFQTAVGKAPRAQRLLWRMLWKGFPPGHFYSPLPSLQSLKSEQAATTDGRYSSRLDDQLLGIDLRREAQREMWLTLAQHVTRYDFPLECDGEHRYYRKNGFYVDPDAVILHAMLCHARPQKVIEVGSGFSSALILDTAEREFPEQCEMTFIDPYPERLHKLLKAKPAGKVQIREQIVQTVPAEEFERLQSGDMLIIDSSHVLKHDSDLAYLLFSVLPKLRSGVYVHFHDICFPFEYPFEWLASGRAWNEAYAIRCFLQYNARFEICLWNHYIGLAFPDLAARFQPYFRPGDGATLWLRVK